MRISEWKKALSVSYVSYLGILFAIIVVDTFYNKDFDFRRAAMISGAYITGLTVYFAILFTIFRSRLD